MMREPHLSRSSSFPCRSGQRFISGALSGIVPVMAEERPGCLSDDSARMRSMRSMAAVQKFFCTWDGTHASRI